MFGNFFFNLSKKLNVNSCTSYLEILFLSLDKNILFYFCHLLIINILLLFYLILIINIYIYFFYCLTIYHIDVLFTLFRIIL